MGNRNIQFVPEEFYHVYNRGVDKRNIFNEKKDVQRFLQSMREFNTVEPIGSLYENSFQLNKPNIYKPLVNIICYCLNPNHFHFILQEVEENGISSFMKRLAGGYTWFFNKKYQRNGSLFQGVFKAKHITDNGYLMYASAYVNLNNKVHKLGGETAKFIESSWDAYIGIPRTNVPVVTEHILSSFTKEEYKIFALESLKEMLDAKITAKAFREELLSSE